MLIGQYAAQRSLTTKLQLVYHSVPAAEVEISLKSFHLKSEENKRYSGRYYRAVYSLQTAMEKLVFKTKTTWKQLYVAICVVCDMTKFAN